MNDLDDHDDGIEHMLQAWSSVHRIKTGSDLAARLYAKRLARQTQRKLALACCAILVFLGAGLWVEYPWEHVRPQATAPEHPFAVEDSIDALQRLARQRDLLDCLESEYRSQELLMELQTQLDASRLLLLREERAKEWFAIHVNP